MLQKFELNNINEIENKITNVLLCNDVYSEFVYHVVKLLELSMELSERKRNLLVKNEIELLEKNLSERK